MCIVCNFAFTIILNYYHFVTVLKVYIVANPFATEIIIYLVDAKSSYVHAIKH